MPAVSCALRRHCSVNILPGSPANLLPCLQVLRALPLLRRLHVRSVLPPEIAAEEWQGPAWIRFPSMDEIRAALPGVVVKDEGQGPDSDESDWEVEEGAEGEEQE